MKVFLAESVWATIAQEQQDTSNALEMEQTLAQISDAVVIVVESPGAIAELGAFSISAPLRAKLLPILDRQFFGQPSFINNGPLKWVEKDSRFGPPLVADLRMILEVGDDLVDRLKRIKANWGKGLSKAKLTTPGKELVFFLGDLVGLVGPASVDQLEYYVDALAGEVEHGAIATTLALALDLKIVDWLEIKEPITGRRHRLYYREEGVITLNASPVLAIRRPLNLSQERARVLEFIQRHPVGMKALHRIWARAS